MKYGIRAIIYLALNTNHKIQRIGIEKISDDLKIPSPFLGKILQILAKNKILLSAKEPNGGFSLARPADEIKLIDVIDIIDGCYIFDIFIIRIQNCFENKMYCPLNEKYSIIRKQIKTLFHELSFEELAKDLNKNHNTVTI